MRRQLLTLIALLIGVSALSQESYYTEVDSVKKQGPALSLKLIPSQLIWRFPAYTMGLEHRLSEGLSVDYTFGLIRDQNVFEDDATYFAGKSGFKSSIMLKSYKIDTDGKDSFFRFLSGSGQVGPDVRPYLGVELFYNQIEFDRTRTFKFDCGDNCEYFQRATYGIRHQDIGVRLNIGFLIELIRPVDLEVNWGIGMMHRSLASDARKPEDFARSYGVLYREDDNEFLLTMNLNIKLVINLK
ncbi:hypothetical protein [Roseivirga misakiensis]|uniref:Outer membrane protein beta-barrel domain-containing protein n=1 Tax=Roseivirga misakiensis TaxID=1563681 RepID=A0A1E5T0H5_9BACT|nr:hypothetical protein [Roseivirga misakiensis]OEK04855.1 hypothetical protein BFP71_15565 [Roseivirga misakiensis]